MNRHGMKLGRSYAVRGVSAAKTKCGKFRGVKKAVILETGLNGTVPDGRHVNVRVAFEGEDKPCVISAYAVVMEWVEWEKLTLAEQYKLVPTARPKPERAPRKLPTPKAAAVQQPQRNHQQRMRFVPVVDGVETVTHLSAFYDYDKQRDGVYIATADGRIMRFSEGSGWETLPAVPMLVKEDALALA